MKKYNGRIYGKNTFNILKLLKNAVDDKVGVYSTLDADIYVVPKGQKLKCKCNNIDDFFDCEGFIIEKYFNLKQKRGE